jgi:hypothetical protein
MPMSLDSECTRTRKESGGSRMKFGARARMNENHQSINQSIASASKKAKSVPLCSIQTDRHVQRSNSMFY